MMQHCPLISLTPQTILPEYQKGVRSSSFRPAVNGLQAAYRLPMAR